MQTTSYTFKGSAQDIMNAILSLLLSKEFYNEVSTYSNFINDTQPIQYRQKLMAILSLMQNENLILIREDQAGSITFPESIIPSQKKNNDSFTGQAIVYIRQKGKKVLLDGGINKPTNTTNLNSL